WDGGCATGGRRRVTAVDASTIEEFDAAQEDSFLRQDSPFVDTRTDVRQSEIGISDGRAMDGLGEDVRVIDGGIDVGERCDPPCPFDRTCCGRSCVDLSSDPLHCGRCGSACLSGQECRGGRCTLSCTVSCPPGTTCVGDRCLCGSGPGARECTSSEACCGGVCTDLNTVANCGACGRTCQATDQCCNGVCRNVRNDLEHCGECGRSCLPTGDRCVDGSCRCGSKEACLIFCAFGTCVPF
ncbi:MAG: hypothetical protein NZM37_13200, partial [Sandaracinaceae bacterium]|nr:hypothetical protein [Sandaracinaceae bacterium]